MVKLSFSHIAFILKILIISVIFSHIFSCDYRIGDQNPDSKEMGLDSLLSEQFDSPAWHFGDEDRLAWQKPKAVIDLLGDLEDKTVADIGAGTGYFSYRIAERARKVIAIDIDTMALGYIERTKLKLPNNIGSKIETRLALPHDPKLNPKEADIVLVVNTYTFIEDRITYFQNLMHTLTPSAQLMIIDFKKKKTPVGPPSGTKVALSVVENELESAGYELMRSDDRMLDYQYIVLARKKTTLFQ